MAAHLHSMLRRPTLTMPGVLVLAALLGMPLAGCGSVGGGVGISVPLGPLSIGVGVGSGGVTAGVGTSAGPLGVGVGVNQSGQVTGNVGVGAGAPLGNSRARVGVGVGTGTVLYDPKHKPATAAEQVAP